MEEKKLGIGSRIKHEKFGVGVIIQVLPNKYRITFIKFGTMEVDQSDSLVVIEAVEPDVKIVSMMDVEKVIQGLLEKWGGIQEVVALGDKWKNGKLILKPADDSLKSKEIPIETFFHKIVMVRDRLRVMEQRINSSKNMSDEEKVNLQQYITRIYGSLTTFNVLFKKRADHFKGS